MENPISLIEAHQKRVDRISGTLDFPTNGTSLDLLRAVYRDPSIPLPVRLRAAIAALPHEHPRLQVVAQVNEQSFADLLDQRLKRIAEPQATNAELINGTKPEIEVKTPMPRRRF